MAPDAATHRVRDEDAFDVEALTAWLAEHLGADQITAPPTVTQFSSGASNLTYLLRFPERDLIMRRPPLGHRPGDTAHDMVREYRIQSALRSKLYYVPHPVAVCEDTSVIGSPFYVMERIDGIIPGKEWPAGLSITREQARTLSTNAVNLLIDLHSVDPVGVGLQWLYKGEGYVARQFRGLSQRYLKARTSDVGSFDMVLDWLDRRQPADRGAVLIHNDFRLDNIVLSRTEPVRPVGLLDWELATIGDPLIDLGIAMAYWVQADDEPEAQFLRLQPTNIPGMLTRSEIIDYYCSHTGIAVDDGQWAFYEVFGLFRQAVIAQQIYHRFYHQHTTNEAFRSYGTAVVLLEQRCRQVIRSTS